MKEIKFTKIPGFKMDSEDVMGGLVKASQDAADDVAALHGFMCASFAGWINHPEKHGLPCVGTCPIYIWIARHADSRELPKSEMMIILTQGDNITSCQGEEAVDIYYKMDNRYTFPLGQMCYDNLKWQLEKTDDETLQIVLEQLMELANEKNDECYIGKELFLEYLEIAVRLHKSVRCKYDYRHDFHYSIELIQESDNQEM